MTSVSPEQIDAVRRTWLQAMGAPDRLEFAVVERLGGPESTRASRACWIIGSVTRLSELLERPGAFESAATVEFTRRAPVTLEELAVERDALMDALRAEVGELDPDQERAWTLAFGLFVEIVVARCLDPFGTHTAPAPQEAHP